MSQSSSEPDRIERDLDQTRARLDSRLTELQDRLSPGQLLYEVMGYFRGSEGADFGRSLAGSVRANPLPAAVTGIGLAWLMTTNSRGGTARPTPAGSSSVRIYPRATVFNDGGHEAMVERVRSVDQSFARDPGEADHAYTERLDQARGQAMGLARHAQETAESFGQRIRDVLASVGQTLGDGASGLRGQAGAAAGAAGSTLSSLGSGLKSGAQAAGGAAQGGVSWAGGALSQGGQAAGTAGSRLFAAVTDSPVLLGALGVAAGALLGALLPQSEQEGAALGGVAGQARDTVRSLAQQAVDGGTHVTQAVMDAGRESAGTSGLTGGRSVGQLVDAALSGDLAGQAKQAASEILKAGDAAVRKELPEQSQSAPQ